MILFNLELRHFRYKAVDAFPVFVAKLVYVAHGAVNLIRSRVYLVYAA
jgi:hypothetical protein